MTRLDYEALARRAQARVNVAGRNAWNQVKRGNVVNILNDGSVVFTSGLRHASAIMSAPLTEKHVVDGLATALLATLRCGDS